MTSTLITAAAVAELLGIKARTVYTLAASRQLTCYRIGGAIRFDPADVEAFKLACRVPAQPRPRTAVSTVRLSVRDPDSELMRYFERRGVKPRGRPQGNR